MIAVFDPVSVNISVTVTVLVAVAIVSYMGIRLRHESRRMDLTSAVSAHMPSGTPYDVFSNELTRWRSLPVSHRRKMLLISAGVPVDEAISDATEALSDEDLRVMIALKPNV